MALNIIRQAEFTRPNDTTAYAVGDAVNATAEAVMTFNTPVLGNGRNGTIIKARLVKSDAGVTSAVFRLYLYGGPSAPTPIADNSPFTLLYSNRTWRLGIIDFTMITEGSGSDAAEDVVFPDLPFTVDESNNIMWGLLTAQGAWTPTALEKFFLELVIRPE